MGDTPTTPAGIYLDPLYYNPDMIIDTAALSERVRHYLNYNQIRWEVFGRLVLGIGQARLSVLLGHPKPWDSLRLRVKTYYMRMLEWMDTRATYGNNPHMVRKATARPQVSRKKAKKIVKPRTLFQWEAIQSNRDKQQSMERRERAALQTELEQRQEKEEKQAAIRQLLGIMDLDQANNASMNEGLASFVGSETRERPAKLQPADQRQQQPCGVITAAFSLSGMKSGVKQPAGTRLNDEGMIESDDDFEEYFGVEEDSQQLTGTHIIVDDQDETALEAEAAAAQEELFSGITGELDDIANSLDLSDMGDIDINFVKPGVFTLPSYPNITFSRLPTDPNTIPDSDSIIDIDDNFSHTEYAANLSPQRFLNF